MARRPALGANFLVLACATWWCPAAGFFPGLALRLPPLLSSEVREKLCAGWTEVQVATHGIRAEWSEMHQQYRDKLDEIRGDAYEYASGTIYYPEGRTPVLPYRQAHPCQPRGAGSSSGRWARRAR